MGFGSFTLGYLLGQSFQNPQDIIETPGKCQADYDNDNDPELRAYGEECYWKAWDKAFKNKTIERLRAHESNFNLFTFRGDFLYPSLSQDEQADMLERGEIKLLILRDKQVQLGLWANNERSEAKLAIYLDRMEQIKHDMENGNYRIID